MSCRNPIKQFHDYTEMDFGADLLGSITPGVALMTWTMREWCTI